jgi:hypothetical protein
MKFMVLYRSSASAADQMGANFTPEQREQAMKLWMDWFGKAGDRVVDGGSPLGESHAVAGSAAQPHGSYLGGYTILECGSLDEAMDLLKDHPHFHSPDAAIEVLECLPMPASVG